MKQICLNGPLRVQIYKERLLGAPLPPKPVNTSWGTRLEVVFLLRIIPWNRLVMSKFDDDIREAKKILKISKLKQQLAYKY